MSDLNGASFEKDEAYAEIPTDVLKETLRYFTFSDKALDYESTCMILRELEKREPSGSRQTPEEALEVFKAEYSGHESAFIDCAFDESAQTNPREEPAGLNMHSLIVVNDAFQTKNAIQSKKPYKRVRTILRGVGVAAAILLFLLFIDAIAFGGFYRQSTAKWSRELFSFSDDVSDVKISECLKDLHDALKKHHIEDCLAPTWVPDGFDQVNFSVIEMDSRLTFYSYMSKEGISLTVQIISFGDSSSSLYESNVDNEVIIYLRNGVEHCITRNDSKTTIYWVYEKYECHIIGDITVEDAEKIIDSVYER